MKYEDAYFSKFGNAAVLAKAIASMLPVENTKLTDLVQSEMSGGGNINFIGNMLDRGSTPAEIREVLLTAAV